MAPDSRLFHSKNFFYVWFGRVFFSFFGGVGVELESLFTTALADGFPREFERQQIYSSLLDSSQYPGQS